MSQLFPRPWIVLAAVFPCLLSSALAERMRPAEEPEEVGLVSEGSTYFPIPDGVEPAEIPNADFEDKIRSGDGWTLLNWDQVSGEAPQGENYLQAEEGEPLRLLYDGLPTVAWRPYLISLWVRSTSEIRGAYIASSRIRYGTSTPLYIPDTKGEWRRVGFYVRAPYEATTAKVMFSVPKAPELAVDDLQVREATEAEFAKAYAGWRSQYPKRDLSPRPEDGQNLPLFLRKLQAPREPGRPLLVMGIGSSYTNMLGNGERLVQHLQERFPNAPPIRYWKHVGSAVEFDYTQGWMQQLVVAEQPDLVILYSGGNAEDLDQLLTDFRARSTADIIIASLHLRERDVEITPETIDNEQWDTIREVAAKHGVEFVESRREWAAYLQELGEDIPYLLKDAVHQSDYGALVINENIVRHITPSHSPAYDPEERERRILATRPESIREGETLSQTGAWSSDGKSLVTSEKGASLKLRFKGNRVDLVGLRQSGGGSVEVTIDGIPAQEFPAFNTTLIVPGDDNHRPARGSTSDRSPHAIRLGENIVPQEWMIQMTSDKGDYELIGSVTGKDGEGNNGADFTSDSGQITVSTALWRRRLESDGSYSNLTGDVFGWSVVRATKAKVPFSVGGKTGLFVSTLVKNTSNGWHEVEVTCQGDGEVQIRGFDVYEPPLP